MADPYFLERLALAGFRAYLQPRTFDFSKKRSFAVFAPNGSGKSSFIDALEFMLSRDGTLDRLGQRAVNNQAGPAALAHFGAEEARIRPSVTIHVCSGKTVTDGARAASGAKRSMPAVAATLNSLFAVPPIIRGHALRAFVEAHTPEQRYTDVANWLRLGPLVEVQKNIRALRSQIKAAAEDEAPIRRIDASVAKETGQAVTSWEGTKVIEHINSAVLAPLDPSVAFKSLSRSDPAYGTLESRARSEENKIGLAGLKQVRAAIAAVWVQVQAEGGEEAVPTGAAAAFENAASKLLDAERSEEEERQKAAASAFEALWKAAEPLFAEGAAAPEACPVCATPVHVTSAGSPEAIRAHIKDNLHHLADYAKAKKMRDDARATADRAHHQALASAGSLIALLGDGEQPLRDALASYRTELTAWRSGASPDTGTMTAQLGTLLETLDHDIAEITAKQGENTFVKAKAKIDRLLELAEERALAIRTSNELDALSDSLTTQAAFVSSEIRTKMQALLDGLRTPMNEIYKAVQGAAAKPIRLDLPGEDETNQQRLHLLVDFADNRPGVQPGGYLSDSQIHSVALALRLAAIVRFNAAAPIVALDDVVTSYDADHRRTIAALIATVLPGFQVLITTHDERFFAYLKDQLEAKSWHFTRIIGLDPSYGPRFADHKVSDEMIQARWQDGASAANEMRQAEEEWLLATCRDFGVSVRIRPLEKAYSYERSELASALGSFLKDCKLHPAPVPGVNNRFFSSLVLGAVENFGSHFQDVPYGSGSLGDEKARWEEFKAFRGQFTCKACGRTKFQRPFPLQKPVCVHTGCEAQFGF